MIIVRYRWRHPACESMPRDQTLFIAVARKTHINVFCRHSSIGESAELKPRRLSVRPGLSARYHHMMALDVVSDDMNACLQGCAFKNDDAVHWCVRIAAIAAGRKPAPSGSRVRVPHAPRRIIDTMVSWSNGYLV